MPRLFLVRVESADAFLYCIGLPSLICGGLIYGLGRGGDVIVGSAMAMLGAFLVGFALPVER